MKWRHEIFFFFLLAIKQSLRRKNCRRKKAKNVLLSQYMLRLPRQLPAFNVLMLLVLPTPRRYWMMTYNQSWFEQIWENRHQDIFSELWSKEFRMRPETFDFVVNLVQQNISKNDTNFRVAITPAKRVAIAVWRLSTGNSYRTVSKVFGVSKSVSVGILKAFCVEVMRIADRFISFPRNGPQTAMEIQKFKVFTGTILPQIVGAIDGMHVEIVSPSCDSKADYFSRKQKYTINTQAVIGSNLMFLDVATGFLGSMHDARMLRSTLVFQRAQSDQIMCTPLDVIEGNRVRPLLLGDGAYPVTTWILKPYAFNLNLNASEKRYNRHVSSARSAVERGFGLLKVRWRCLLKRLDILMENLSSTIITCCVLHNICQQQGDDYIDHDKILPAVLHHERMARRRRSMAMQNRVCNDGDTLKYIMKTYISNM